MSRKEKKRGGKIMDSDNSVVIARRERWREVEEDKVGINGDAWRLDLGW